MNRRPDDVGFFFYSTESYFFFLGIYLKEIGAKKQLGNEECFLSRNLSRKSGMNIFKIDRIIVFGGMNATDR